MKLKNFELKPCPYCGGKAEYKHKKEKNFSVPGMGQGLIGKLEKFYLRCSKCHAKTETQKNVNDAVFMWNLGEIHRVH